jgi:ADP-dependent phosphofructokinase/glucokinase
MDVSKEIAEQVEKLPPDMQEQVLRFVASLATSAPVGENGARLRQFSSSLDSVSARQMTQAIDEECERVDASEW